MAAIDRSGGREAGTASVELVAAIPFLILATLAGAQLCAAAASLWSAGIAARAGARADLVGGDAVAAARRALPAPLRPGARVRDGDEVTVRVPVPRLVPGMPDLGVAAAARLEGGGG